MPGYVLRATLLSLLPSLAVSALLALVLPASVYRQFESVGWFDVFGVLVVSPWGETLLMLPIFWVLKRFVVKPTSLALGSAACWGMLHAIVTPTWGLVVAWPFFVFSVCFLAWQRRSRKLAIIVTSLIHTFHNLLPAVVLISMMQS